LPYILDSRSGVKLPLGKDQRMVPPLGDF